MMKVEIKEVKISEIKLNPDNPRRISKQDMDRLVKSLNEFPDMLNIREIVVDETMTILGGNMRYLALKKSGAKTATAKIVTGLTKEQKREFVIKDNSNFGEYDFDALANGWSDLPLADWGVDLPEDWLGVDKSEPADAEPQIDRAEELNKVWGVKLGDLWQIGSHKLLCGDSTKKEDVGRVMGGEKADILFTDPPYGITLINGNEGKVGGGTKKYPTTKFKSIQGDNEPFDPSHLFGIADAMVIWGGNYFADKLPVSRCWFIWNKNHATDRTFSGCELAWTDLDRHAKVFECTWDGYTKQGESGAKVHPSQKPIKLCTDILTEINGDIIVDLYFGSGTTMVACQNLNRKCRGIEISPAYCAVILQRMTDAFPGIEIKKVK